MIDNFAIPAATIRGLFDYDYRSDRLVLHPRIPGSITYYAQKQPVRFGGKKIYLSCRNGGPDVKSVRINGIAINVTTPGEVDLMYSELPADATIEITTEGGWPEESSTAEYPVVPALMSGRGTQVQAPTPVELADTLKNSYEVLKAMKRLLEDEPNAEYERAFVAAAMKSFEDCRVRATMDAGPGYYRAMTPERRNNVLKFYERAALGMYDGLAKRMAGYAERGDMGQIHLAVLFDEAQK